MSEADAEEPQEPAKKPKPKLSPEALAAKNARGKIDREKRRVRLLLKKHKHRDQMSALAAGKRWYVPAEPCEDCGRVAARHSSTRNCSSCSSVTRPKGAGTLPNTVRPCRVVEDATITYRTFMHQDRIDFTQWLQLTYWRTAEREGCYVVDLGGDPESPLTKAEILATDPTRLSLWSDGELSKSYEPADSSFPRRPPESQALRESVILARSKAKNWTGYIAGGWGGVDIGAADGVAENE
jgi:hypothetical protein